MNLKPQEQMFLTPYKTNSNYGNNERRNNRKWVVYVDPTPGQKSTFFFSRKKDANQWISWFKQETEE